MARILHGQAVSLEDVAEERRVLLARADRFPGFPRPPPPSDFGYMFPRLHGPLEREADFLPDDPKRTLEGLDALGAAMATDPGQRQDSSIPAAYTYLGQFIDHDITLEASSTQLQSVAAPDLRPMKAVDVVRLLKNLRTAPLDLDSVYAAPLEARDGERMRLGEVIALPDGDIPVRPVPGKTDAFHDLPRKPRSADPAVDREALIGDPRNDENLVIAQLHTAFLRAHNQLVEERGLTFEQARLELQRHYQWIVVNDFLPRLCGARAVLAAVGRQRLVPQRFMPLEFSAAAYRFGHSMVRGLYNHNVNFPEATLQQLFTFSALSGNLNPAPGGAGFDRLPENWVIQWELFVAEQGAGNNFARPIDTALTPALAQLPDTLGVPLQGLMAMLATRNLRRGFLLRLPTGQAIARELGLRPLSPLQLLDAVGAGQRAVLERFAFLQTRTPLWFYVLAEAAASRRPTLPFGARPDGHLGPVGSHIVAQTLVGLVRQTPGSYLQQPGWRPSLGSADAFKLRDLLVFANVLD